jgi:hypothetical protein
MAWERRKTFRFKPQKAVYVSINGDQNPAGVVLDMGLCGLSFHPLGDVKHAETITHVTLFTQEASSRLSALPCSLIYQGLQCASDFNEEPAGKKRYGLKLNHLETEQWCALADLLTEVRE